MKTVGHRSDIDGLRAVAIVAVLAFDASARRLSRHRCLFRRFGLPDLLVDPGGSRERHFRSAVFLSLAGPPRVAGAAHGAACGFRLRLVLPVRPRVPPARRGDRHRCRLRLQFPVVECGGRRRHRHPLAPVERRDSRPVLSRVAGVGATCLALQGRCGVAHSHPAGAVVRRGLLLGLHQIPPRHSIRRSRGSGS